MAISQAGLSRTGCPLECEPSTRTALGRGARGSFVRQRRFLTRAFGAALNKRRASNARPGHHPRPALATVRVVQRVIEPSAPLAGGASLVKEQGC